MKLELKQYYWRQKNLKKLEQRLEELETMATNISPHLDDMPKAQGTRDKIGNHVSEIVKVQQQIAQEINDSLTGLYNIENAIKVLPEREKYLMRARYFEAKNWEEICVEMGYSWMQIHRIHGEALEKIKMV